MANEENSRSDQQLYEQYSRLVARVVWDTLPAEKCNHQQDVINDIWLTVLGRRKIETVNDPKCIPAWLMTTAKHRSLNHIRDVHKKRPTLREAEPVNIERAVERSEVVSRLLEHSKPSERRIIELRIADFSYKEIAEQLGMTESNVKATYLRAIHKFKKHSGDGSGR